MNLWKHSKGNAARRERVDWDIPPMGKPMKGDVSKEIVENNVGRACEGSFEKKESHRQTPRAAGRREMEAWAGPREREPARDGMNRLH